MPLDENLRRRICSGLGRQERLVMDSKAFRPAAVAVVVLEEGPGGNLPGIEPPPTWSDGPAILLTRRSAKLRAHAGQWALPGGTIDPGESAEAAALRELREEVGLQLGMEQVLGKLDDFTTRSGFVITPVVMWAGMAKSLVPNDAEVASVHRIPLAEFMRPDAPLLDAIEDSVHPVLRMPVGDTWIAAPTAAFLYQFRELCIAGQAIRVAHYEQPIFARK
ncbi:CoA pyrophosphatase [Variovorax sp. J2P1-59]|uniref:NUDIX hydrolase n=1 Tax=Variovorax flavidus TaxID=3053501 RepID=UPI002578A16C|nr:CoA pyrophosphatase [Variovorax sp. J2P1-59]MDM0077019.1 CoA pyrophosphatase [Variovorax sp. J2P1-59]